jgi:hypothetical protein
MGDDFILDKLTLPIVILTQRHGSPGAGATSKSVKGNDLQKTKKLTKRLGPCDQVKPPYVVFISNITK